MALAIGRFARARMATFVGTLACVVVIGAQEMVPLGPGIHRLSFAILVPLDKLVKFLLGVV